MVNDDIYTALNTALGVAVAGIYDTKLPDNYELTGAVVAFSLVSDIPDVAIDGAVVHRVARWQVSVRALDLPTLRSVKATVITALHGYRGASISRCDFESAPGELFESATIPFCYHAPIDFMVQY